MSNHAFESYGIVKERTNKEELSKKNVIGVNGTESLNSSFFYVQFEAHVHRLDYEIQYKNLCINFTNTWVQAFVEKDNKQDSGLGSDQYSSGASFSSSPSAVWKPSSVA